MRNQGKELYEFGPFRLDPGRRVLLRDNQPVPLQLKAFETLLVLVRNSEQVVLKDELMQAVWPDSFVEESNLAQNIFVLRRTLGASDGDHRYIVTIPGRGYSFAEKVRPVREEESLVMESHSRTRVVIDEHDLDEKASPEVSPAVATPEKTISTRRNLVVGAAILVLAVAAFAFRPQVPPPRVVQFRQLTHLGTLVHNTKLVTDGPRVYFRAWEGKERVVRYVSTEGGDVFPVDKVLPEMDIDDLSPSGSELLEVNLADLHSSAVEDSAPSLWRVPVPSGSPQPVGNIHTHDAKFSPDGRTIAYAVGSDLYLADSDGNNPRKLATVPGDAFYPEWSPDGRRLRFSLADPRVPGASLWEADIASHAVRPLLPNHPSSERMWAGGWTPDSKYFYYSALGDWTTRNLWAIREHEALRRVSPQPVQITAGPLTFYLPVSSKDGKTVFAVGEQLRGQLEQYDPATHQFVPYAHGISADHVAYSRDGQWMAYVEFPAGALVRSRIDGSERRQLTFPPMRVFSPQWSPDGTQIAFQASAQLGAISKIYLLPSAGGAPSLAAPETRDRQMYPSWASDGASIVFSTSDVGGSNPALQKLDLQTRQVVSLPGTGGLSMAQISPDGRSIVAVEQETDRLILYDVVSHHNRTLADFAAYPRWTPDGKFVYFNTPYWSPRGINGGVYRWSVSTNTTEPVIRYPEFLLTGAYGVCYGVTPEGNILMVRDVSTRDLYALDMDLP